MDAFTQATIGVVIGGASTWFLLGWVTRGRNRERTVAALLGALVGAASFRLGSYDGTSAALAALLAASLVSIATCDILERRIPNRLTYPSIVALLSMAWLWSDRPASAAFLGVAIAVGFLLAALLITTATQREGATTTALGLGDLKLVVVLGGHSRMVAAGVGAVPWRCCGGFGAAAALARRKRTLAYAPYLVVGGLIALLWPDSSPWQ